MSFEHVFARLDQKLSRHERVVDLEQRRADYRRVSEELVSQEDGFRRLLAQVKLFREGELPLDEVEPLLQDLIATVESIESDWKNDPVMLLQGTDRWDRLRELTEMIETILGSIYEGVHASWQSDALPVFYAPLTRQTAMRPLVERIQSIDSDLPRLLPESIPNEASRLRRARALKAERDRLKQELEAAIPADLRTLFSRIARGEATLGEVTPELLEQIRQLQAERVVRLTLR